MRERFAAGDIDLRNIKTVSALDTVSSPDRRYSSIEKNDMFIVGEDQNEGIQESPIANQGGNE